MDKTNVAPLVLLSGLALSTLVAGLVTIVAVGPRSRAEAAQIWRDLRPRTPAQMTAVLTHIDHLRRDPEIANMYFLSRFLVMIVLESVGQLFSGMLSAVPGLNEVPDRLLTVPFALLSLWLAAECLIAYRRITNYDAFRHSLIERVRANGSPADLQRIEGIVHHPAE